MSIWSSRLSLSLFGESHGRGVGLTVHGLKAGIRLNSAKVEEAMRRRHAGEDLGSSRVEADEVSFLSGLKEGYTTGAPLTLFIENRDVRSGDYEAHFDVPRPSHSDYVNRLVNGRYADVRGGGHFSGRLTAPMVALAGFLREELDGAGLRTLGHISQIGQIKDGADFFKLGRKELEGLERLRGAELEELRLPMLSEARRTEAEELLRRLKAEGDSIGARCEVAVLGLPAGLGEPFFEGLESRLGALLFSIPGVKAVEFGLGAAYAEKRGSEANDEYSLREAEGAWEAERDAPGPGGQEAGAAKGKGQEGETQGLGEEGRPPEIQGPSASTQEAGARLETRTNYGGGISGGISNGMPLIVSVTFRPTPSIAMPQRSVSLSRGAETEIRIQGRHDACIALKGLRAMDAALRIALAEYFL